jgi:hypothetical protein
LDHDALRRRFEVAAADQGRRALGGAQYVVEHQSGCGQLCRIDVNLPFAHFAAEDLRLRDPGNRQDLRFYDPLHHIAQLQRGQPVARVAEMHQVFHRGTQWR